ESNLSVPHKVSTRSPISLIHIASFALLAVVLFFFADTLPNYLRAVPLSQISNSLPAQAGSGTCESPIPFSTQSPVSKPHTMALQAATKKVVEEFTLSDEKLQTIVKEFIVELKEGLEKNGTTMAQIPTYGLYMAVDLGGTNFRVCSIQLNGDTTFHLIQSKVAVPQELMRAKTAKDLFGFLAKQIEVFLKTHHKDQFSALVRRRATVSTPEGFRDVHIFRLGFTFSFPVHQVGINRGTLMRWTKGFNIADAVGQDVCMLLQKEIDALKLPVKVAALVNDTVGTLMARGYSSPGKTGSLLGAIFGTGTNGAYLEKLSAITKPLEGNYDKSTGEMVINTEWGSFDNSLKTLPNTPYDTQLDAESINPGMQMFEKRISGMFLGELLRLALVSMWKDASIPLFSDDNSSQNDYRSTASVEENAALKTRNSVDSSILSFSEADNSDGLRAVRQAIYKNLGFYPGFLDSMRDALRSIPEIGVVGERKIRIGMAHDGSGVGAALIALAAAKMESKQDLMGDLRDQLDGLVEQEGVEDEDDVKKV
ncbi:hexokinase, partial [Diplocarpon rosae]